MERKFTRSEKRHGMNVQADLEKLESQIRLLKINYDMFFSGALPKQPYELKKEVDTMIKKYAYSPTMNYAQRFHFNSLVSRYNAFTELWSKTLRELEEKGKSPLLIQMVERPGSFKDEATVFASALLTESLDVEKIRALHSKYIEARNSNGEKDVKMSFDNFAKQITKQAMMMREKTKCNTIEIKILMKDKKVVLIAKALQEET